MSNRKIKLDHVSHVAISLARQAGQIIRTSLRFGIQRDWKRDHTPVTSIDKQINQLFLDTLHTEFPSHNILAEEASDLTRSKEYVWVCDPLDGTFPFIHGIPLSTVTISLVHQGQPIFGLIYDPFTDRMFVGDGINARLNGQIIHTSTVKELSHASVGVVYWKGYQDMFTPLLNRLTAAGSQIYDFRSIAYMDAMVAAGEFEATIFPGENAHDSVSGKILVESAGGVFTSLTGEVNRYDQKVYGHIAAANPAIYREIKALLD